MRTHATRRERFLPYRYARSGLELSIERCLLDDRDELAPDGEAYAIDLDAGWTTATLDLRIELPEETRDKVLAPGTPADAIDVLVIVRSPATFFRSAVRVPMRRSHVKLSLVLQRDQLAGLAELEAVVVRTTDASRTAERDSEHTKEHATARGVRIADSRTWQLRIDRAQEPRGEYLDIRYHPFSKEPTVPARDHGNLYLLRLEQETPELWINADHERIAAVFDSKGTVGRQARLREVAFDQVAHGVWTQLFMRAARDYVANEETSYAWQDAVLDLLLRDVFPELRSVAERRDRLAELWGELPLLLARLDAALQRRAGVSAHLSKLIEEAGDRE
jgi:hypothetical protein